MSQSDGMKNEPVSHSQASRSRLGVRHFPSIHLSHSFSFSMFAFHSVTHDASSTAQLPIFICQAPRCLTRLHMMEGLSITDHATRQVFRACSAACLNALLNTENHPATVVNTYDETLANSPAPPILHSLHWTLNYLLCEATRIVQRHVGMYFHVQRLGFHSQPNEETWVAYIDRAEAHLVANIVTHLEKTFYPATPQ